MLPGSRFPNSHLHIKETGLPYVRPAPVALVWNAWPCKEASFRLSLVTWLAEDIVCSAYSDRIAQASHLIPLGQTYMMLSS